eukprot:scaffold86983_cov50-Phaeocystis_antarctica.AAC.2
MYRGCARQYSPPHNIRAALMLTMPVSLRSQSIISYTPPLYKYMRYINPQLKQLLYAPPPHHRTPPHPHLPSSS